MQYLCTDAEGNELAFEGEPPFEVVENYEGPYTSGTFSTSWPEGTAATLNYEFFTSSGTWANIGRNQPIELPFSLDYRNPDNTSASRQGIYAVWANGETQLTGSRFSSTSLKVRKLIVVVEFSNCSPANECEDCCCEILPLLRGLHV